MKRTQKNWKLWLILVAVLAVTLYFGAGKGAEGTDVGGGAGGTVA